MWETVVSIKTMLVLLDDADDATARLDTACSLAERYDAHLNALALSLQIYPYTSVGLDAGAAAIDVGLIEEARQRAQSVAAAAKKTLETRGAHGEVRWSSRELSGQRDNAAIHGRFAELTIVGQPVEGQYHSLREWAVEGALLFSGRPLLMVPSSWQGAIDARHVIVAWDASREAARALNDAMPFIEGTEKTTVLIVDPKPGDQEFGDEPGADIAPLIARHCSNVVVDRIPSSGASIAEALLERSSDASGDLIVMGGYGHSPLRESIFGGVSRDMIRLSEVPLLLSH
jgi:nucleotide-binding universal stress UspA family protein